jgi:hypothetical protein
MLPGIVIVGFVVVVVDDDDDDCYVWRTFAEWCLAAQSLRWFLKNVPHECVGSD